MQKRWHVLEIDEKKCRTFAKSLGVSEVTAGLLLHRGIDEVKSAQVFLQPEKQEFYDPFLMKDMDKAVERIKMAIEQKEKIVVYGDYDVDGITATTLLKRNLTRLGADVEYYIPDRQKEGYGFNSDALQRLADAGTDLLVSVDCGISAVQEAAGIQGKLDLVITDHHLPGDRLPEALAVVNPHREDCAYPDKNLSGVGVAFKLCQALWKSMNAQDFTDDLEIVALGTIADIVPLLGENRKIVRLGLERMQHTSLPGLQALLEVAKLQDKELNAGHVGFVIAPRLNAAGRMDSAAKGTELLITTDRDRAHELALQLDEENQQRQEVEREILAAAEKQLQSMDLVKNHVIVLAGENWHPGVIGIVASRIVDKYYRPTIIISTKDGIGKGSCRSIAGFHMYEALDSCSSLLLGFGGHAQAAGLSIELSKLEEFQAALNAFAEDHLQEEDYTPVVDIEFELAPDQVSLELIEEMAALEPYGMGNPKPRFGCRNLRGSYAQAIGREGQHLRFKLEARQKSITALAWNKGTYAGLVNQEALDLVYVPEINVWNGRTSIQCMVEDFSPARQECCFPDHAALGQVYLFLRSVQRQDNTIPCDALQLTLRYIEGRQKISLYTMEKALAIFQELGLLQPDFSEQRYIMPPAPKMKLDLMKSSIYRKGLEKNKSGRK